jgi:hypothetical protein
MPDTQKDSSKGQADKAQPESAKRTTVKAEDHFDDVLAFVRKQGAKGATLKAIAEATNLPGRVVHNITWRLEGSPEIHEGKAVKLGQPRKPDQVRLQRRSGTGRSVVYELVPSKSRRTTKATAKAS